MTRPADGAGGHPLLRLGAPPPRDTTNRLRHHLLLYAILRGLFRALATHIGQPLTAGGTINPSPVSRAHAPTPVHASVQPVLLHAMAWSAELGVSAISPAVGEVLRLLAAASRARAAVEIGTGIGVSSLWLLCGMIPDGVLTSIDIEAEYQAMARQSFAAAGFGPGRTRLIAGDALEVLPRLADDAYDLVFIDGDVADYAQSVSAAHRLLRHGGVMILTNALIDAKSPVDHPVAAVAIDTDRANSDDLFDARNRTIVKELVAYLLDAPEWDSTVLAVGNGLLCATKASLR